jgi:hypothetical protein
VGWLECQPRAELPVYLLQARCHRHRHKQKAWR